VDFRYFTHRFVIRNFSTWSSVEMPKGYMIRERLGTSALLKCLNSQAKLQQTMCVHRNNVAYLTAKTVCAKTVKPSNFAKSSTKLPEI